MSEALQCCGGGLVAVWVIVLFAAAVLIFGGKG